MRCRGHPERPDRHRAIISAMGDEFAHWTHHKAPKASRDQLELVHHSAYIDQIFDATSNIANLPFDADTAGPHSLKPRYVPRVGLALRLICYAGQSARALCARLVITLNQIGRWGFVCFQCGNCGASCTDRLGGWPGGGC